MGGTSGEPVSIKVAERQVEPLSALAASVQVDTPENARPTFQHVPNDLLRTRSKGGGP